MHGGERPGPPGCSCGRFAGRSGSALRKSGTVCRALSLPRPESDPVPSPPDLCACRAPRAPRRGALSAGSAGPARSRGRRAAARGAGPAAPPRRRRDRPEAWVQPRRAGAARRCVLSPLVEQHQPSTELDAHGINDFGMGDGKTKSSLTENPRVFLFRE